MSAAQLVGVNSAPNLTGKFSEFKDVVQGYLSGELVNKEYVDDEIKELMDGASDDYDTLKKIEVIIKNITHQQVDNSDKLAKLEQINIEQMEGIAQKTIEMYKKLGYKD